MSIHQMITPQQSYPKIAAVIGVRELWFKREDLHPFGSHKGRSIPVMIEEYIRKGARRFVISSSGNAAIATVHALRQYHQMYTQEPLSLSLFIGKNIGRNKLNTLQSLIPPSSGQVSDLSFITLHTVARPKQAAFEEAKKTGAIFLRQSTDDLALLGYHELALELAEIPHLSAVFIPTSSGTTAQGIGEAFEKLERKIEIHIVQTTACSPIVRYIRGEELLDGTTQSTSLATAIVDCIGHRRQAVASIVEGSGGGGWIATNEEIKEAVNMIKKETGIDVSSNSALSVAGVIQAVRSGFKPFGAIACVITGP